MLRSGDLHVVAAGDANDGPHHAVTIRDRPGKGVLVWAGLLKASARNKSSSEISRQDYVSCQVVNFARWTDLWAYYEGNPEYGPLMESLHLVVDARIASGDNAPEPRPSTIPAL